MPFWESRYETIRRWNDEVLLGDVTGCQSHCDLCHCVRINLGDETPSSSADNVDNQERTTEVPPTLSRVEIQTDPPRGTVLIDSTSLGVAPVQWEVSEGDVFLMCVDWEVIQFVAEFPKAISSLVSTPLHSD